MKPVVWFVMSFVVAFTTGVGSLFLTAADLVDFGRNNANIRWKKNRSHQYKVTSRNRQTSPSSPSARSPHQISGEILKSTNTLQTLMSKGIDYQSDQKNSETKRNSPLSRHRREYSFYDDDHQKTQRDGYHQAESPHPVYLIPQHDHHYKHKHHYEILKLLLIALLIPLGFAIGTFILYIFAKKFFLLTALATASTSSATNFAINNNSVIIILNNSNTLNNAVIVNIIALINLLNLGSVLSLADLNNLFGNLLPIGRSFPLFDNFTETVKIN